MESLYKKKLMHVILSALLLAVLILVLAIFARSMEYKKQQVIDIKERLASYEQNKKIFQDETKRLGRAGERVAMLEAARVTTENLPTLLSSLETLALNRSVTFAITQVETPLVETGPQKLTISFSAQGSLVNLQAFLSDINHQVYQVRFTSFSLYLDKEAKGGPAWDVLGGFEVISF